MIKKNNSVRAYSLRKRKKMIFITDFKKYVKQISDRYENPTDLALLHWLGIHNLALSHCISEFYKNRTNTARSDANVLLNIIKHFYFSQHYHMIK